MLNVLQKVRCVVLTPAYVYEQMFERLQFILLPHTNCVSLNSYQYGRVSKSYGIVLDPKNRRYKTSTNQTNPHDGLTALPPEIG